MKYATKQVSVNPPIFKRKLGAELMTPITLASTAFSDGVCKAGTPINASGAIATTSGGTNNAIGILLNNTFDENPNGSIVKAYATVNTAQAEANSGISYDSALKSALPLIVFE